VTSFIPVSIKKHLYTNNGGIYDNTVEEGKYDRDLFLDKYTVSAIQSHT